jgi:hypothetical protein
MLMGGERKNWEARGKNNPPNNAQSFHLGYTKVMHHFFNFFDFKLPQEQVGVPDLKEFSHNRQSPLLIQRNLEISTLLLHKFGFDSVHSTPSTSGVGKVGS